MVGTIFNVTGSVDPDVINAYNDTNYLLLGDSVSGKTIMMISMGIKTSRSGDERLGGHTQG